MQLFVHFSLGGSFLDEVPHERQFVIIARFKSARIVKHESGVAGEYQRVLDVVFPTLNNQYLNQPVTKETKCRRTSLVGTIMVPGVTPTFSVFGPV